MAAGAGSWWRDPRQLAVVAAGIGVVGSVVTFLIAAVLSFTYRSAGPEWFVYGPSRDTGATEGLLVIHTSAAAIAGMGAFAAFLVMVWPMGSPRGSRRDRRKLLLITGIATVVAAVAIVTRDMVTYEQVAFWSVRVGEDLSGYWTPALDSDVRFVIVDATEVGPTRYLMALTAHLLSPLVTAALLAGAVSTIRRGPTDGGAIGGQGGGSVV